jgi:hypothetical protein
MTPQEKALSGVKMLQEALLDYLSTRKNGVPATQMREDLGLDKDADPNGQHKGMLMWGVINLLIEDGKVEINRNFTPHRICLVHATAGAGSR